MARGRAPGGPRRPLRYRGFRVSSRTQKALKTVWLVLALAALVVVGIAGVMGKAESAGRTISAPAAIALGVVWAAGIAVVFRSLVAQLMSD